MSVSVSCMCLVQTLSALRRLTWVVPTGPHVPSPSFTHLVCARTCFLMANIHVVLQKHQHFCLLRQPTIYCPYMRTAASVKSQRTVPALLWHVLACIAVRSSTGLWCPQHCNLSDAVRGFLTGCPVLHSCRIRYSYVSSSVAQQGAVLGLAFRQLLLEPFIQYTMSYKVGGYTEGNTAPDKLYQHA
jgi:hypothetical protein